MTISSRVNPKDGLPYVWIPPGSFVMVSTPVADDEAVRARLNRENQAATLHNLHTEEGPVAREDWEELFFRPLAHKVTLTRGFWMGQTPVTQEAYQAVTGTNPSQIRGAGLPVHSVTWNQAKAYCEAVGMRLPTEAEWEYAARGGATASYPDVTSGEIQELAWHSGNSSPSRRIGPGPWLVGHKRANAFGLQDMLGNVWEWVADCFWAPREPESAVPMLQQLAPELGDDVTDPERTAAGTDRVLRGGSCLTSGADIRATCRRVMGRDTTAADIGFRCVGA